MVIEAIRFPVFAACGPDGSTTAFPFSKAVEAPLSRHPIDVGSVASC